MNGRIQNRAKLFVSVKGQKLNGAKITAYSSQPKFLIQLAWERTSGGEGV